MSQIVENERAKLTAAWLNTVSGGLMTAGVITPFVAFVLGLLGATVTLPSIAVVASLCLLVAIGLHLWARFVLRRLR